MPLISSNMQSGFLKLQSNMPKDRPATAKKWAEIYDSYASGAQANGIPGLVLGRKQVLEGILLPALMLPAGLPPVIAAAWSAGLVAYWGGVLFGPGVAAPPPGAAALIPALTALLLVPTNTPEFFALQLSTLLDVATKTVIVVFPPPIGPTPVM